MNDNLKALLAFLGGAAVGSVATYFIVKTKYEQIAQEEIDSVKEVYAKKYDFGDTESYDDLEESLEEEDAQWDRVEEAAKELHTPEMPPLKEYAAKVAGLGYAPAPEPEEEPEVTMEGVMDAMDDERPYVIDPIEFGDDDYEQETLTYYADGVLTDEWDNVIENVDDLVGTDSLTHFGEYEEDCVHVRNDLLKTDFEICRDLRKFSEVRG